MPTSPNTEARSFRFERSLWARVDAYGDRRMLATKLAVMREIVEAGLDVLESKPPGELPQWRGKREC